jgi:two-component system chemotaxis sensor kinase CheA
VSPATLVVESEAEVSASGGGVVITDAWHISVRFGQNVLRGGMDPLSFIRYLSTLGEILAIETIPDGLPEAAAMDPESSYLGFEIRLQTRSSKADIERVFDFCRDECDLRILPPNSKLSEYIKLIKALPEDDMRLGEILTRCGALTEAELEDGLRSQSQTVLPSGEVDEEAAGSPPQIGEILVDNKVVHKEVVAAAISKQTQVSEKKAVEARLIRVQADKLDQLIDLVGELVIAGASANLLAQRSKQTDLVESTSILSRLVENIRDSALQLRMVQIGETFNRFNRVVRDVSKEIGKEIDLVITGAETELDKTVVEKIGDPLMHLVRNSMDHGIEPADVREAHGKPRHGRVELNAYHDSGSIVIEVIDDGSGLPREKILQKAIEKGLVQPSQQLSDQEIVNLIWEPGFSTAEQVTNLSGRGVGMDVVRRNIQSLRGSCEVTSQEGEGTTFTIRLPLTLAIIDGFLVGVGKSAYVIPLDMVVECIELKENTADRDFLNLRGEVLPFVRLRSMFEIEGGQPTRENIVVVQYAGQKAGIVVDQLMGEFQTVIKPLSNIFRHLRGIGGSTILGTGEVALILDVQTLVQRNARAEERDMNANNALPRSVTSN